MGCAPSTPQEAVKFTAVGAPEYSGPSLTSKRSSLAVNTPSGLLYEHFRYDKAQAFAARARLDASLKLVRLRAVQLVVLDNTARETTVAQIRGHTLADKHRVTELVRATGIRDQIVATFSSRHRSVDDQFVKELVADPARYAGQRFYCFAEVAGADVAVPTVGLARAAEYGLTRVVLEMDGLCSVLRTVELATAALDARIAWARAHKIEQIYLNYRDFPDSWDAPAGTLRGVTAWLAARPVSQRIEGIVFEDFTGGTPPHLFGAMTAEVRAAMAKNKWDGHLLVHVHNGFGLAEASVLEALACGADGIWCGTTREGAACGHANSLTTITNLVRLGNVDAAARFNLAALRAAAVEATVLCTGALPHPSTELYGSRSLDIFLPGLSTGDAGPDMGRALLGDGLARHVRVSSLASEELLSAALDSAFGTEPSGWPRATLTAMVAAMNRDLRVGVKVDYDSPEGLFALLTRCTPRSKAHSPWVHRALAALAKSSSLLTHPVLISFRALWVQGSSDVAVEGANSNVLTANDFFDDFMGGIVTSPSSELGVALLRIFDVNGDGSVHVSEAEWPLVWAFNSYPGESATLPDALTCVARRLAMPLLYRETALRRVRSILRKRIAAALLKCAAEKK